MMLKILKAKIAIEFAITESFILILFMFFLLIFVIFNIKLNNLAIILSQKNKINFYFYLKKDKNMAYTIKKVEKETKISAHTLRFWAKKGLFPFVQKDENSVKYFSKSDIEWAKWIEWLRISGMPIEQVKHYIKLCSLGIKTAKERQEMLKQTKKKLQNQIKTLKESEKVLSKKIKIYEEMLANEVDGFNPESKDYQPCDKFCKES